MVARTANVAGAGYMNVIINTLTADMINVGYQLMAQSNLVTNATNTSNSIIWNILKSPKTNNAIGNDWFVAVGTDQPTNTWFWWTLFCGWNVAGTNLASQFVPSTLGASSVNYYPNANGFANSASIGANVLTPGNVFMLNVAGTPSIQTGGNGCNYIYTVTIDRLIISFANTAAANLNANAVCLYAGTYDSFMPLCRDPYPLIFGQFGGAKAISTGTIPGTLGASPNEPFGIQYPVATLTTSRNNFNAPLVTALSSWVGGAWDQYMGLGKPARIICGGGGSGGGSIPSISGLGGVRGMLKDVFAIGTPSPTGSTTPILAHGDVAYFIASGIQYNLTYCGNGSTTSAATGGALAPPAAPTPFSTSVPGFFPWVRLL